MSDNSVFVINFFFFPSFEVMAMKKVCPLCFTELDEGADKLLNHLTGSGVAMCPQHPRSKYLLVSSTTFTTYFYCYSLLKLLFLPEWKLSNQNRKDSELTELIFNFIFKT